MSAVLGFDVSNVAIGEQRLPRLRQDAHERIVGRVDHQGRLRDAVDHIGGGGSGVVIIRPGETAIVGGHAVVELSQGFDSAQTRSIEVARKQPHLAAKAPE